MLLRNNTYKKTSPTVVSEVFYDNKNGQRNTFPPPKAEVASSKNIIHTNKLQRIKR